tara:strand:+ start:2063 stop:2218 length:156 start_codon:yes stop_codon:yes gene_type:complete
MPSYRPRYFQAKRADDGTTGGNMKSGVPTRVGKNPYTMRLIISKADDKCGC